MNRTPDARGEATRLIHDHSGPMVLVRTPSPPIQRSSTVLLPRARAIYEPAGTTYGRGGLATQGVLCEALAVLENAERAFLYPSGLAAISGVLQALTAGGDHLLVCDSVYNPTRRFLAGTLKRFGVDTTYYSPRASADEIEALIRPQTRLIYLESPGSLTFELQDVAAIAAMARRRGLLTVIDNTYAAGVLFKPLDHGVDVSLQALTKYVCGHSDVFMGMAAASGEIAERLAASAYEIGWAVSPDDAYMALRGMRTLHGRLKQHGQAALEVATWLQSQAGVSRLLCPALPSSLDHALWRRDFSGACGLFGVVLTKAPVSCVEAMLDTLKLFGLGYSWGGFESLAIPSDPQLATRATPCVYEGPVLRLHIGLEDPADLIDDLTQALEVFNVSLEQVGHQGHAEPSRNIA